MQDVTRIKCPICGREVVRSPQQPAPYFPFCCKCCKLIDLGKWLGGDYRIEEPLRPRQESEEEPSSGR